MRSLKQSFMFPPSAFQRMQKVKFCFPSTQGFHAAEPWSYLIQCHANLLILVEVLFLCLIIWNICTALNGSLYDSTQTHLYGEDKSSWYVDSLLSTVQEAIFFLRYIFFSKGRKYHILFWMIARRLILAIKEESWISLARIMHIVCTYYT